jgi:chromosome segregation ATPase
MEAWHTEVSKGFEHFTDVQLPELDGVVHKHIDILRVAEQDHYNQITAILKKAVESRCEMSDDMEELKANIGGMKHMSDDIAKTITKHTLEQLSGVTKSFENQIISLKSHSEQVRTSLYEGENTLSGIREKSELIMKQMILSSKKMSELEQQNSGLQDIYSLLKSLIDDVEKVKSDYIKSQSQLSSIAREISVSKDENIEIMKRQIDSLGESLSKKIDESLEKLHEHYHIAEEDITKSVQILTKKAQLKKGYGEFES